MIVRIFLFITGKRVAVHDSLDFISFENNPEKFAKMVYFESEGQPIIVQTYLLGNKIPSKFVLAYLNDLDENTSLLKVLLSCVFLDLSDKNMNYKMVLNLGLTNEVEMLEKMYLLRKFKTDLENTVFYETFHQYWSLNFLYYLFRNNNPKRL